METAELEIKDRIIELSTEAFKLFCDDIADMFGLEIECVQSDICQENSETLRKRFGKLAAVSSVKAEGTLHGTFQIIFDQGGLFTLSGVIVMVPEGKILEDVQSGSIEQAKQTRENITEVTNLLIGALERVFQEDFDGHGGFTYTNTFISTLDDEEESIDLPADEELVFVPYQITINPYPTFNCGVILPQKIFDTAPEPDSEKSVSAEQNETEQQAEEEVKEQNNQQAEEQVKEESKAQSNKEAEKEIQKQDEETKDTDGSTTEQQASDHTENKESDEQKILETVQGNIDCEVSASTENTGAGLALCAKDIMQKDVVWGSCDDSVQQGLAKMQQADAGYMLIGQNGQAEGIVSKSDLAGAVSPFLRPVFAKWHRAQDDASLQIKLKWIMSRPVRTIGPETNLPAIMEDMSQFGGRCLPVMDEEGKIQGLVTVFEIFKAMLKNNWNITLTGKAPQSPPLV